MGAQVQALDAGTGISVMNAKTSGEDLINGISYVLLRL
jgi:hypothetical protein